MIESLDSSSLNNYKTAPSIKSNVQNEEQARKTAEDFEAFFISQMFQDMFAGVEPDSMFGGGNAEEVWNSMLIDEYGKMTAKSGGIGIADNVMKFMLQAQEV